jgi:23S rRNA pseudouridine2605 synthase
MTEKRDRIAKVIAAAGICSRRDAERLIADGRVTLNGKTLTTPAVTVAPDDVILVDGKKLRAPDTLSLWLYHKPPGLVTTAHDPEGRETVFDALPRSLGRVISVGRLDLNSEGLLLLTNSGALSRHLELPSTGLPRTYRVRIFGDIDDDAFDALENGITIDGIHYKSITVERDDADDTSRNQWVTVTLHEGKNREIRRVFQHIGLHVSRLVRTGYGPFDIGSLARGKVTAVSPAALKKFCDKIGFKP